MRNESKENTAQQHSPRLSIPISATLATILATAARKDDRSVSGYVRNALRAALRADGYEVKELNSQR